MTEVIQITVALVLVKRTGWIFIFMECYHLVMGEKRNKQISAILSDGAMKDVVERD